MSDPYQRNGPAERVQQLMEAAFAACTTGQSSSEPHAYFVNGDVFFLYMQACADADLRAARKRAFRYLRVHAEERIKRFVERRLMDLGRPPKRLDRIRTYYE